MAVRYSRAPSRVPHSHTPCRAPWLGAAPSGRLCNAGQFAQHWQRWQRVFRLARPLQQLHIVYVQHAPSARLPRRGRSRACSLEAPCVHSGNHDVGLGRWESPPAVEEYERKLGPLNYAVDVGNFTFVVRRACWCERACATGGAHAYLRGNAGNQRTCSNEEQHGWRDVRVGMGVCDAAAAAVQTRRRLAAVGPRLVHACTLPWDLREMKLPRILLSHIPLHRPPGASCGRGRGRRPLQEVCVGPWAMGRGPRRHAPMAELLRVNIAACL